MSTSPITTNVRITSENVGAASDLGAVLGVWARPDDEAYPSGA